MNSLKLSVVTKDGALSFAEFCTAMHLVVLRVRNFPLPDELPPKLQPYPPLIDFNSETSLNTTADSARSILNEEAMVFHFISYLLHFLLNGTYSPPSSNLFSLCLILGMLIVAFFYSISR